MNLINDCPECGKILSQNRMHCNCGWKTSEEKKNPQTDYRCNFKISRERCSSLGTFCPYPYGNKWYCDKHWKNK